MKSSSAKNKISGFNLVELLVIIAIISIFAAMLLPADGGPWEARKINCANNLKTLNESFAAWSQMHGGKLPMQVSPKDGGTINLIQSGSAMVHFLALTNSNQMFPYHNNINRWQNGTNYQQIIAYTNYGIESRRLICPGDSRDWIYDKPVSEYVDTNISYFVDVNAMLNNPKSILIGDRNLEVNGMPAKSGLLELTPKSSVGWTEQIHYSKAHGLGGNILFGDGRVEFLRPKGLNSAFQSATNRLAVP